MTKRSRGRPRQDEGPAVTREELLRLAARAIGRGGLARASMRGLAREAGVSLATVQHHFRTRDLLWKAVIEELLLPAEQRLQAIEGPREAIATVVRSRLGTTLQSPGLAGRLLADGSPEGELLLNHLAAATSELRERDRDRISSAVEAGRLRAVDVDALIVLLGIALPVLESSKSAIRVLAGPDLDDEEQRARLAEGITDILLHGLLPRETEP